MKITVNGESMDADGPTLEDLLGELDQGSAKVATAVNELFVPASARATHRLSPGDRVEIVSPRQGG